MIYRPPFGVMLGQTKDYRIASEGKGELIQQFTANVVIGKNVQVKYQLKT